MSHFLGDDDDDFVLAGVEAYNNFLFEEFCAADPTRLIGLAQIPSLGIDTAVDALRKAKARGAKGVHHLELAVGRREPLDRRRPVLGRGGRRGHAGVGPHQHHQPDASASAARKAAAKQGNALVRHGQRGRAREGDRRHEPRVLDGGRQHHLDAVHRRVRPLPGAADLLDRDGRRLAPALHRVRRRPLLAQPRRGVSCRSSSRRRSTGTATTRRRSSPTVPGSRCATRSAIDNIMWSSDYPHHGNDWPYSRKVIEETMGAHPRGRAGEDHRRQRGADLAPRGLTRGRTRRSSRAAAWAGRRVPIAARVRRCIVRWCTYSTMRRDRREHLGRQCRPVSFWNCASSSSLHSEPPRPAKSSRTWRCIASTPSA